MILGMQAYFCILEKRFRSKISPPKLPSVKGKVFPPFEIIYKVVYSFPLKIGLHTWILVKKPI